MHPLQQLLTEYCSVNIQNIHEIRIPDCPLSFLQLRDRLCHLGTILHEDRSQQIYVVSIRSGFADLNQATVALRLQDRTLIAMGYAREGLIPQHTCERALQKLSDAVHGAPAAGRSRKLLLLPLALMALIIVCFIVLQARLLTGPSFPSRLRIPPLPQKYSLHWTPQSSIMKRWSSSTPAWPHTIRPFP